MAGRHRRARPWWSSALAILLGLGLVASAAACPAGGCSARREVVCGEDGNTYQNRCFAACQNVRVLAKGRCSTVRGVGSAMAQAFAAAAATDGSLGAAVARVKPLSAEQLDAVAAAASGVARGFDHDAGARVVTAAEMTRFASEGLVLVGVLQALDNFTSAAPRVPSNAAQLTAGLVYDNLAATIAVGTPDGLIYKPRSLAREANLANAAATARGTAGAGADADWVITPPTPAEDDAGGDPALNGTSADLPAGVSQEAGGAGGASQADADAAAAAAEADAAAAAAADADAEAGDGADAAGEGGEDGGSSGRRRLQKVFPPDGRVELLSHVNTLIRAAGFVSYGQDGGNWLCSGVLIGPQTVLTAAHCVLSTTTAGATASNWKFAANRVRSGKDPRYGEVSSRRFYFDTRFWSSGTWWVYDIAIVVVSRPVGKETGTMGFGYQRSGYKGSLFTAGYPGDKPKGSLWWIPGGSRCVVADNDGTDTLLEHMCDVYPGQSGSPMWLPSSYTVIGVVSWESQTMNGACAINPFFYAFISDFRLKTS